MKAFQAYATGNVRVTADSPKEAQEKFFSTFPDKRKCNIVEGEADGRFFTVSYGRHSEGKWPLSFKDVTRKTVL